MSRFLKNGHLPVKLHSSAHPGENKDPLKIFKEQGITIVSILTAVGMAIGVLVEALLGGPTVPTTKSGNNSGGAREWVKNN